MPDRFTLWSLIVSAGPADSDLGHIESLFLPLYK
jgi:hypothetical protein